MVVHTCLLGTLEVYREGSKLTLPHGNRLRALLAWLASYPGPHPRARLAGRFWPEVPDSSARASLRSAVWTLRGRWPVLGVPGGRPGVRRPAGGLRAVDVREFSELAAAGRLREAVSLCRGELLPELDDDWVDEERRPRRAAGRVLGQLPAPARRDTRRRRPGPGAASLLPPDERRPT